MNIDEYLNNLQSDLDSQLSSIDSQLSSIDSQLSRFGLSSGQSSAQQPASGEKKFCPDCGTQVEADAKFCPNCGFHFIDEEPSATSNEQAQTPAHKRKFKVSFACRPYCVQMFKADKDLKRRCLEAAANEELSEFWGDYSQGEGDYCFDYEREVLTWDSQMDFSVYDEDGNPTGTKHMSTGCMAVTTAMICAYYKYPETVPSAWNTSEGVGNEEWTYNYEAFQNSYSTSASQETLGEMPMFMFHIANHLNTDYSSSGSGATQSNLLPALRRLGFNQNIRDLDRSGFSSDDFEDIIYAELQAKRPVNFIGEHDYMGGHSFLCDGYQTKSAKRKKEATATLSVVDLSKIKAVEDAFNALLDALRTEYGGKRVVRWVAYGVRTAESFGGASKEEGHTNLTDLVGILEGMLPRPPYEKQQEAFKAAVQDAVAYSVCGTATTGAHGLSLWYPISSSADEIADYVGLSPLKGYGKALSDDFSEDPVPLKFLDEVKVDEKGGVTMTVDPTCADAFFDLYVVNEAVDGSYRDTNVDISDNWDNLTFAYNPATAVAITLDGMVLDASIVAYEHEYEVFSAPVVVDGEETNLRIAWIWDESETAGGYYKLLGVWNGIDYVTGVTDRPADGLRRGSTVEALSTDTGEARQKIVVGKEVKLSNVPLAPGRYECHFVAQDLMGNEYPSDTCTYEVDNEGTTHMVSIGP